MREYDGKSHHGLRNSNGKILDEESLQCVSDTAGTRMAGKAASGWPGRQKASDATTAGGRCPLQGVWCVSPTETPVKDRRTSTSYRGWREVLQPG